MNIPFKSDRQEPPADGNTGSRAASLAPKIEPAAHPTRLQEMMDIQSVWLARHRARMADES